MACYDLYNGDCLIEMQRIADKSIDAIICDLPYGTTACKWDTIIPFEPLWKQYKRIIKDNGAIVLFGSEPFASLLRLSNIKDYKYDWVWDKGRPSGFSYAKHRPMLQHEMVSIFGGSLQYYPQARELSDTYKARNNRKRITETNMSDTVYGNMRFETPKRDGVTTGYPKTIIHFEKDASNQFANKLIHPTQKPVALLEYLIKTYTNEGETVLDNTMGSGTTGVACMNTNRNFIGIELDKNYFDIAEKRIKESTNQAKLL